MLELTRPDWTRLDSTRLDQTMHVIAVQCIATST